MAVALSRGPGSITSIGLCRHDGVMHIDDAKLKMMLALPWMKQLWVSYNINGL